MPTTVDQPTTYVPTADSPIGAGPRPLRDCLADLVTVLGDQQPTGPATSSASSPWICGVKA